MRSVSSTRWLVLFAILTFVIAACGAPAAAPSTSASGTAATAATAAPTKAPSAADRIKAKGGFYVAIFSSPPLSYLDGSSWVGSEADFTRECAQSKLGLPAEQVYPIILPIAGLLPGLQ